MLLQEHPGAQLGLVNTNRAPASSETELARQKTRPEECSLLLPESTCSSHNALSAQSALLFITYSLLVSPFSKNAI